MAVVVEDSHTPFHNNPRGSRYCAIEELGPKVQNRYGFSAIVP